MTGSTRARALTWRLGAWAQLEDSLVWNLISYFFFQLNKSYEINFPTKISSFLKGVAYLTPRSSIYCVWQELESLRNELEEQVSGTAAAQEVRAKRESELVAIKNQLESETKAHEKTLAELRDKNRRQMEELRDQLDAVTQVSCLSSSMLCLCF